MVEMSMGFEVVFAMLEFVSNYSKLFATTTYEKNRCPFFRDVK